MVSLTWDFSQDTDKSTPNNNGDKGLGAFTKRIEHEVQCGNTVSA